MSGMRNTCPLPGTRDVTFTLLKGKLEFTFDDSEGDHVHLIDEVECNGRAHNRGVTVGSYIKYVQERGSREWQDATKMTHDEVAEILLNCPRPFKMKYQGRQQKCLPLEQMAMATFNHNWPGIGIAIDCDGNHVVVSVKPGLVAHQHGVKVGNLLCKMGSKSTRGMTTEQVEEFLACERRPYDLEFKAGIKRLPPRPQQQRALPVCETDDTEVRRWMNYYKNIIFFLACLVLCLAGAVIGLVVKYVVDT